MTSVLIVDDDDQLRAAIARDLAARGFTVRAAASVVDALDELHAHGADILLTDLRIEDRDGIDLIALTRRASPHTRPILMSAYATARDCQSALELGAVGVLSKPFTPTELLSAIQQAIECETGFRGSIHGLSLIDLLQMFHFGRRTVTVHLGGMEDARIDLADGEVVHARRGALTGEDALREILGAQSGSVRTSPRVGREQTISKGFQSLILDSLRQLDEATLDDETPEALDDPPLASIAPYPARSRWDAILQQIERLEPSALVALVPRGARGVPSLRHELARSLAFDDLAPLDAALSRLAPDWQRVELLGPEVGLAAMRIDGGLVVVGDVLTGRYAALRFRSEMERIARCLSQSTTAGGDDGKDR